MPGVQPTNIPLAFVRDRLAKQPPMVFDQDDEKFLVEAAQDAVTFRKWELYGATAKVNHLHLVVGWREPEVDEDFVQTRLKRGIGYLLAKKHATEGRTYFSRGGMPERVRGIRHLKYLLDSYFPKHFGPMWRRPGI